ncbi:hypothetical protein B0I35DRAFT_478936 [Stachybotrys elegans]|uniref:Trimethyllysine dioxygenase n=1 Tax=Stachybotrys elegans TaxID=80388 RepID=A0A8K0WQJ3_9HYPO|nr:hypothetical protein B0I35DRAFT_478936 [Stachybotrys elegans]
MATAKNIQSPVTLHKDDSGRLLLQSGGDKTHLSSYWLRDNCRCSTCVNQDTLQRENELIQLDLDVKPLDIIVEEDGVRVTWTDSHTSHHPWEYLLKALHKTPKAFETTTEHKLWDASIASNPPEVAFETVMSGPSSAGMAVLTDAIMEYGFCFVSKTPATPEATQELLESIGPIRHTHYGGFYDFKPDLALADTAYTNLALPAHTDNTYFSEPAGLQAFHMLSHTMGSHGPSDGQSLGGLSLLVDGYNVANQLRRENETLYEKLAEVKVPYHASGNQDVAVTPYADFPVISTLAGQPHIIRWNDPDRGILPADVGRAWYEAAQKWASLVQDKGNEYWFQLEPGRVLIFDNWRVLHGRSSFTGIRRMCGAYIGRDDFISRWKLSNFPRNDVIMANMHRRID